MLVYSLFEYIAVNFSAKNFSIETCEPAPNRNGKPSVCIADNFENSDQFLEFGSSLSNHINISVFNEFCVKSDMDHGRYFDIELNSGKNFQLLFDQGVSFWAFRSGYTKFTCNFENLASSLDHHFDKWWNANLRPGAGETYIVWLDSN